MVEATSIQAIKRGDVHRITSGQVILDVQSAVKELIENALDAGATSIEVRFKEYGADSIEVADNGSGIEAINYEALGLKHHTSKLRDFGDLASVQTFGFRGEALSSLCELAKVQVITATQDQDPLGTLIELNRDGSAKDCDQKVPRQRGTTVTAAELFHTLPVRRSELLRNVRREFAKVQSLLQAYAIIAKNVRWVVTNTVKGRKVPIMTTSSSATDDYLMANVRSVFGAKASAQLVPLNISVPLDSAKLSSFTTKDMAYNEADDMEREEVEADTTIRVSGLLSRPAIGYGRSSSDRCFLYVNGRPWDAPKIVRAFNEIYRQFNVQQSPMVVADFTIKGDAYDVNVSPDKRTLFIHKEAELVERLKMQLEDALNPFQSHFKVQNTSPHKQSALPFARVPTGSESGDDDNEDGKDEGGSEKQAGESVWSGVDVRAFANGRRRRRSSSSSEGVSTTQKELDEGAEARSLKVARTQDALAAGGSSQRVRNTEKTSEMELGIAAGRRMTTDREPRATPTTRAHARSAIGRARSAAKGAVPNFRSSLLAFAAPKAKSDQEGLDDDRMTARSRSPSSAAEHDGLEEAEEVEQSSSPSEHLQEEEAGEEGDDQTQTTMLDSPAESENRATEIEECFDGTVLVSTDDNEADQGEAAIKHASSSPISRGKRLAFDLNSVRAKLSLRNADSEDIALTNSPAPINRTLAENAAVEQNDAQTAEAALSRFIEKSDFGTMQIVGQFNLGFIIARLLRGQENDLFIIDQHAADEKYNFENLTETTKLQSQRLIVPRILELSPANELIAVEHEQTLADHGFHTSFDQAAAPGSRLTLVALPVTQRVSFGVEDLEELLHRLRDERPFGDRARRVRCSKLRSVLASRACRKSIMIGTALSQEQMRSVVGNLGTLDQPWNCPHGRPTMRHLFDLNKARRRREEEGRGTMEIDWQRLSL